MKFEKETPSKEARVELINTLLTVTEGKIFVELERARLTKQLAEIKEADGKVAEAAEILQGLAVETFGSMTKQEKIAFILEQVRLCMDKHDYIRAHILSNKVSPKAFASGKGAAKTELDRADTVVPPVPEGTPPLLELKIKYYTLMIRYYVHNASYLEIARAYRAIFDTLPDMPEAYTHPESREVVLKKVVWFTVLAPRHPDDTSASSPSDQCTMMRVTREEKALEGTPGYRELLDTFLNKEIVRYSVLAEQYTSEVHSLSDVFGGEQGSARQEAFRSRVTEHNVLVVAEYYSRLKLARMAELLDLPEEEAERHVSRLVVSKALTAKIDRPAGVIRFGPAPNPRSMLNEWAGNITQLLDLVETGCQQIAKEAMEKKVAIEGLT